MPGDQKPKKLYADLLGEEIKQVTSLPNALTSLVQGYLVADRSVPWELLLTSEWPGGNCMKRTNWAGVSLAVPFAAMRVERRDKPQVLTYSTFNNVVFSEEPAEHKWDLSVPPKQMWDKVSLRNHIQGMALASTPVHFIGASLKCAEFAGIMGIALNFANSYLGGASLKYSMLLGTRFDNANAIHADFSFAYGHGCMYIGAPHFRIVPLSPKDRVGSFTCEYRPLRPSFLKTDLTSATLYRSNFCYGMFDQTIFKGANLSEALFSHATFDTCSMESACLAGSICSDSFFSESNLSNVNATEADFRNAKFCNKSNLENAILSKANLVGAYFGGDVKMSGAQLNGAHFDLSQFSEKQVLSFYYAYADAPRYMEAMYQYKKENENHADGHKKELDRANTLIMALINQVEPGENKLLEGFLLTGSLSGESMFKMFDKSDKSNPKSLCARLLAVRKQIEQEKSAGEEQKAVPTPAHK